MSQAGRLIIAKSLRGTQFRGAIAQNAAITENIQPPGYADGPMAARVRAITIISLENLAWELWFFASALFQQAADIDTDGYLGKYTFAAGDGLRIAAAGYYYYYIGGLDIPLDDTTDTGALHLALVNRSAAAKTTGAGGELVVKVSLEPTLGW